MRVGGGLFVHVLCAWVSGARGGCGQCTPPPPPQHPHPTPINRAHEFATKMDEPAVWSELGNAYLDHTRVRCVSLTCGLVKGGGARGLGAARPCLVAHTCTPRPRTHPLPAPMRAQRCDCCLHPRRRHLQVQRGH